MKPRKQTNLAARRRQLGAGPHGAALSSPRTIIRPSMLRRAGCCKTVGVVDVLEILAAGVPQSPRGSEAMLVLEALLARYQDEGVTDLGAPRILRVTPGTLVEWLRPFGGRVGFEKAVRELQSALYPSAA